MAPRQARHSSGRTGRSCDSTSAIRRVYRASPVPGHRVLVRHDGGMTDLGNRARTSTAVVRRPPGSRSAALVLTVVLATTGCTSFAAPDPGPERERERNG